ncbi:hypothetical protein FEP49_04140 [Burkholderia multivorans]|nr:hypothetical protein [Burkholderia multivorans]
MTAVLVVAPAKQRRALVQPGRVQCRQVFGQPVNLLVQVRLVQVIDGARRKRVRLAHVRHEPVLVRLDPDPRVFRQRAFQRHRLAEPVRAPLEVAVREDQVLEHEATEVGARQQRVLDVRLHEDVALHVDGRAVMRRGPERAREPVERQRRLVPVPHAHALDVIEQLAPIQHGDRVAEREHFRARGRRRLRVGRRLGAIVCAAPGAASILA